MNAPVIVWFRLDLRLDDNPALDEVIKTGAPIIPLYIWSPQEEGRWAPGSAGRYWLHHALQSLHTEFAERGSRLILRHGPCLETLQAIIKSSGATAVCWNRCYEPRAVKRDQHIATVLREQGIEVKSFNAYLLSEPDTIKNKQGGPFKIYTPFWKHFQTLQIQAQCRTATRIPVPGKWPASVPVDEFALVPMIKWYQGLDQAWDMTGRGARQQLRTFIRDSLSAYPEARDYPARDGVSRLSPYLHFGQISVRELWQQVHEHERAQGRITPGTAAQAYLRQLVWREFACYLLYHFPHTADQPLNEKYKKFPWRSNKELLAAWQRGETGYPIVDAGMRELWQTGWMHNRVRMITASFLTKDLLIHWHEGARWFWNTLVDADLANNTLGWQWVAGCGADAAPYYRIFNPVSQGERFDPEGEYVRRWLPELSRLDKKYIHQPWTAPASILAGAGIRSGSTYPQPVVDHAEARKEALACYQQIRQINWGNSE